MRKLGGHGRVLVWMLFSTCAQWGAAQHVTSLTDPSAEYTRPASHYVVLQRGDIKAVVVDNESVDEGPLDGHHGGYGGLAAIEHSSRAENLFVPKYSGLNFEHIHDGRTRPRDVLFEPRRHPMQLRAIDAHTVELYQPPTDNWHLESCQRFHVLADGTLQLTIECIPREDVFENDYIGIFFASYIHQPVSRDIFFRGWPKVEDPQQQWIRGVTPAHGVTATHRGADDERRFARDADFPLTLVFNESAHRYVEPWYYGVSHRMAWIVMFRPQDHVRFSQSPTGGGEGNPAWDFQYFIPSYQVGQVYRFVVRAMYVPFESSDQVDRVSRPHRQALAAMDDN